MTHLTLTGYYAGRPLCDCDKDAERAKGAKFIHAMYATALTPDVCPACKAVWEDDSDDA